MSCHSAWKGRMRDAIHATAVELHDLRWRVAKELSKLKRRLQYKKEKGWAAWIATAAAR